MRQNIYVCNIQYKNAHTYKHTHTHTHRSVSRKRHENKSTRDVEPCCKTSKGTEMIYVRAKKEVAYTADAPAHPKIISSGEGFIGKLISVQMNWPTNPV